MLTITDEELNLMSAPAGPPVPPILYVPCEGPSTGDEQRLDFRRTNDGRLALMAYTALDRLVTCCGEAQPWVLVLTAKLDEINTQQPYDVIFLDVEIPDMNRRTAVTA